MNKSVKVFSTVTSASGSSAAVIGAFAIVLMWALTGPIFQFSDTWQLVINTGTTVITFLMVFVIQNTQNRETQAMHAKLDAIIEFLDDNFDDPNMSAFIRLEEQSEQTIKETRSKEEQ